MLRTPRTPAGLVKGVVKLVLTMGGSATCGPPLATDRYVNAAYGSREGCVRAQRPGSVADRVDFKQVRVNGDRATAVVVPTGGPADGERVTVSLVHDPEWSVDRLRSSVPVGP
ncbi:MAG: hypothetical protein ACRDK1_03080 [Solirubrobacterales bacterium]